MGCPCSHTPSFFSLEEPLEFGASIWPPGPQGLVWSSSPSPEGWTGPRPPTVLLCMGAGGGSSAGRLTALPGLPRVVYRTVYRQVVKTDHRKRLKCCQGFYESREACVRESWVGRGMGGAQPTLSSPSLHPPG